MVQITQHHGETQDRCPHETVSLKFSDPHDDSYIPNTAFCQDSMILARRMIKETTCAGEGRCR
jgi:hypothetical protein